MTKTYVPRAVTLAGVVHKYLTRYQASLSSGQTAQRVTALINLVNCLAAFLVEWQKPAIEP